jgi:hypothetical protein
MRKTLLPLAVLLLAGCGDPIVTLPGGALSGELAKPPSDWSSLEDVDTIQVEFRPSDPYSHNIWAVGIDGDLYIATSADGTRWTPFLETDPRVRARHGSALYELVAAKVVDAEERARVAAAYQAKYALDADDNWVGGALIFRLDRPRSP